MLRKEKTGKSLIEECEKKCIENVSNAEHMCTENLIKFQKDMENYAKTFKSQIQSELDAMSNELKKEFSKNAEFITDSWSKTLVSYKNVEMDKVKHNFQQITEDIKRDADVEIHRFNKEFKEKLKTVSEDKLDNITEQLDVVLRDEINLTKTKSNKNDQETSAKTHNPHLKSCTDCSERELQSR